MSVCISLELYDKAEDILKRAIRQFPDEAKFYSSFGVLLGRQDRLEVC